MFGVTVTLLRETHEAQAEYSKWILKWYLHRVAIWSNEEPRRDQVGIWQYCFLRRGDDHTTRRKTREPTTISTHA